MILWVDVTVLVAVRWISQLFPQNSGIKDKTLKKRCPHFFFLFPLALIFFRNNRHSNLIRKKGP